MDANLRRSIVEKPRDRDLRLAFAAVLAGTPEEELVRLLLERPSLHGMNRIRRWFARHGGSPTWTTPEADLALYDMNPLSSRKWMNRAFERQHWPDEASWRSAVLAVADQMLPFAKALLPPNDPDRLTLEGIAARLGMDAAIPSGLEDGGSGGASAGDSPADDDPTPGSEALRAGQEIYIKISMTPGDAYSEVITEELMHQYQVLGWSWLGLPTLYPTFETSPVPPEGRKGCVGGLMILVFGSPLILFFLSGWLSSRDPSDPRSFLAALVIPGTILLLAVMAFLAVFLSRWLGLDKK
jgi:hypothetical protein